MRRQKALLTIHLMLALIFLASAASAGDFDWMKNFNVWAEADPTGFRTGLTERFGTSDAQINTILGTMKRPSDTYMIYRLGEMSSRSPEYVMDRYKSKKGNGWGALAQSLGIKPGSKEFHALKRSDDFYDAEGKIKHRKKGSDKKIEDKHRKKDKTNKSKVKDKGLEG